MNFSLNIHDVTDIIVGTVRENTSPGQTYATRTIEIRTKQGDFEISLFSVHVDEDHDKELLRVRS